MARRSVRRPRFYVAFGNTSAFFRPDKTRDTFVMDRASKEAIATITANRSIKLRIAKRIAALLNKEFT